MDPEPNQTYSSLALWRGAMVAGLICSLFVLDFVRDVRSNLALASYGGVAIDRPANLPSLVAGRTTDNGVEGQEVETEGGFPLLGTDGLELLPEPPLVLTDEVKEELKFLLVRQPRFIPLALERGERYFPVMRQILEDEGLPHTLINLALIESGFNANARSHMGAVGMWQFIRTTGEGYGLKVSWSEDQRKDPILSTIAAARHLRDLYIYFDDWYLALAAYNAGLGAVDRARSRAGSQDFWQIKRRGLLPRETAKYVPRFIAVTMITERWPQIVGEGERLLALQQMYQDGDVKGKAVL